MKVRLPLLVFILISAMTFAQFETNYNENNVPEFTIPDLLTTFEGQEVATMEQWKEKRRPELYSFFENSVYGKVPDELDETTFKLLEEDKNAFNGKAIRKQVEVTLFKNEKSISFTMLIYLPKNRTSAPIFLGYNFYGNHSITEDTNVLISQAWAMNNESLGVTKNKLTEASRGNRSHRWAIDTMIKNGFGLATIYYGEVDPDKHDFTDGIHSLFYKEKQEQPKYGEWGSLAAWAFALSSAMDYFEKDANIDSKKVVVFGHSRLGKAALWAGVRDQRFAAVVSNNSGCGGAALSKRKFGETINVINSSFPHWFCRNFKNYNNLEEALPVDQHQLLALMAPRPVYVASAQGDQWADPRGEFLATYYASPIYELFDKNGIKSDSMPEVHMPVGETISYHIREGKHNVTQYDWDQYIKWANVVLK